MQVGNSREMLGCKPPVQCVQSLDATILTLDVGLHEADIGSKVLEESLCYGPAQNRYAHMGILVCTTGTAMATSPSAENRMTRMCSAFTSYYCKERDW